MLPRPALVGVVAVVCLAGLVCPPRAVAQARSDARLLVTVVDQTNAVIPGATVSVVGVDDATRKAAVTPAKSSESGVAVFERLAPGRYSVSGEFPGFDLGLLRDVRLKAGDNKHVLVLPLQKLAAEVTVGLDPQTKASDRGSTFGTSLSGEQISSLSEDPNELQRQLDDMAGPGATIRVDSFEGGQLPPKAQIKAVHITRDSFAAENHYAGGTWVDIITQPGVGALRGSTRFTFYDSALDGKNPLIPAKGPAQNRNFNLNLSGALQKEKSGFTLSASGANGYSTPDLYVATLKGTVAQNLNLRQPSNNVYVYGSVDYALTKDQTLKGTFNTSRYTRENQGVGAYDLATRAYSSTDDTSTFRLQEAGPIGRRLFMNTRLSVNWSSSSTTSALETPTIVVLDAFTSGGAQRSGGRKMTGATLASDLDYVSGRHSWRAGFQVQSSHYRSDDFSNYLGTYTFESLAAYEAGTPRSYTRRVGDPLIEYRNTMTALYVQDDIRLRKTLTLSPGVRFETQSLVPDGLNIGPRMGVTWAPFKAGRTTFRTSAGVFYDWFGTGTYEQTMRVDGVRQREMNVIDPSYPDPGTGGVAPPTNRYLLSPDLRMVRNIRFSGGIDQQFTKQLRVGGTYAHTTGSHLLVGRNMNAPVDGVRPDAGFANVIEATSEGESRSNSLSAYMNLSLASQAKPGAAAGGRLNWRRGLSVFTNYNLGRTENNTDGAFSTPATGRLGDDWGPSSSDMRHRISTGFYSEFLANLNIMISVSASSGMPYTIRTGYDDNGDLIFNDRPAGVGRNTERAPWMWTSYGSATYSIGLGKRTVALPPGITISGSGANATVSTVARDPSARYRLQFTAWIYNLANQANYTGYSGVMTSPFFKKPTSVDGVRSVNLAIGFSF